MKRVWGTGPIGTAMNKKIFMFSHITTFSADSLF